MVIQRLVKVLRAAGSHAKVVLPMSNLPTTNLMLMPHVRSLSPSFNELRRVMAGCSSSTSPQPQTQHAESTTDESIHKQLSSQPGSIDVPPPTATSVRGAVATGPHTTASNEKEDQDKTSTGDDSMNQPTPSHHHERRKGSEVKDDMKSIASLAIPLMFQSVFGYLLSIVCTVAIGRLGPAELAASSLANSLYIVTGLSMVRLGLRLGGMILD